MNQVTRDIMKLLKCDADRALRVQSWMGMSGFDFSEASEREFRKEVRIANKEVDLYPYTQETVS